IPPAAVRLVLLDCRLVAARSSPLRTRYRRTAGGHITAQVSITLRGGPARQQGAGPPIRSDLAGGEGGRGAGVIAITEVRGGIGAAGLADRIAVGAEIIGACGLGAG